MKCLACKQEITDENRQTYKFGLNLPYCKDCTDKFNANKNDIQKEHIISYLKAMSPSQRRKVEKLSRPKLENLGLSSKEIDDVFKELEE